MKIHHLRSATAILTLGEHRLLLDPMLSKRGRLPGFKVFGGGRRANPLVDLPSSARSALENVTAVLITHEHLDHLDPAGVEWIKQRGLSVWASHIDAANLRRKGLDVHEFTDGSLGMRIEVIPSRHGRGLVGWLLGPVGGYYLAHPREPSLYVTGDSILTPSVVEALKRLQPDVVLAPAGSANCGIGGDILFSPDELVELVEHAPGQVVFNHLEALDHCPTTRTELRERMEAAHLSARVQIPEDGQQLVFERGQEPSWVLPRAPVAREPGLQKWVTARFTGT